MRFYEFEAKRLLKKHGIPVPQSGIAQTAADAERLAGEFGGPVTLKAQVLSRALLTSRGVKAADSPAQAKQAAEQLLQLDDGGRKPKGILVEKQVPATKAYSLAVTYDGVRKLGLMAASDMAGNIEDIAESHPTHVARRHFSVLNPFSDYLAKELVADLGLTGADLTRVSGIVARLAQLFLQYDLTQADVYALAKQQDGSFVALDCQLDMEVEGRPRQKSILEELGIHPEDRRLPREPTQFEIDGAKIDAEDPRGVAGPVVEFDGNIGLVIGAGGGSLTLTDAVRKHGGRPANYAAIGGNPSVRKAQRLTKLDSVEARRHEDRRHVERGLQHARRPGGARGHQGGHRPRPRPEGDDRDLPRPRRLGGGRLQDPCEVRRRVLRPFRLDQRGGPTRGRENPGTGTLRGSGMAILLNKDFTFIVQGITGREAVNLHPGVPAVRLEDRRRRHARARAARTSTACPCTTRCGRSPRRRTSTAR